MSKVIIFGLSDMAEVAYYYLTTDSNFEVVAFCVNKEYLPKQRQYKSLPIVDFEKVDKLYPRNEFKFFLVTSAIDTRKKVYDLIKSKGYSFVSYVSSKAVINNCNIGENCFVQEGNSIQPYTKIGNNVMLYSGNNIAHHCVIKDFVTLGSHVVVAPNTIINKYCNIGANSTILYRLNLEEGTRVAMGSVITKNTKKWNMYMGNPAKKIGIDLSKSFFNKRILQSF